MIRIGILGDIGSGKSYVAKSFNYPVFNADKEVEKLYKNNKKYFQKLKKKLPKHIFSYPISKKEISKAIIANQKNLKKINKIVHPFIREKMNKFVIKNKSKKIILLDIPLLLENKINKKNYIIIFVEAKKKDIISNLKKRKNFKKKIFKILNKFQLSLEFKKKRSDFVIKNNFNPSQIRKSVKMIKKKNLYK